IFHIDVDPVKAGMGFWHYPSMRLHQADTFKALDQILRAAGNDPAGRNRRVDWIESVRSGPDAAPEGGETGPITAAELTRAVRARFTERSVVVFVAPTATGIIPSVLRLEQPGAYLNSGGTGLGWGLNAAIGVKLARPEAEVVALVGVGCFQFAVPSSAYW